MKGKLSASKFVFIIAGILILIVGVLLTKDAYVYGAITSIIFGAIGALMGLVIIVGGMMMYFKSDSFIIKRALLILLTIIGIIAEVLSYWAFPLIIY